MGFQQSKSWKHKELNVISLNYSGILLSPFEFFSGESQQMTKIQTNLSNIYKKLLQEYSEQFNQNKKVNKFKWSLGKIDQKMQKQRYSPLYNKNSSIKQNRLMGEDEFKKEWQNVFEKNIQAFKQKDPGFKYTQEQMEQAKDFDLLCYKSILLHVYPHLKSFELKVIQGLNVQIYKKFMEFMFGKTFLNQERKLEKTLESMKNESIDIVFAQEASETLINRLRENKNYQVFTKKNCDSIIIIRKDKFDCFYTGNKYPLKFLPQMDRQLSWNDDTVVAFVDNFILISGHLSSKKQKNSQQVYEMMQSLKKLHLIYPTSHIIVGCDANSFIPNTLEQYCQFYNIQCENCSQSYRDSKSTYIKRKQRKQECSCYKNLNCKIYPNEKKNITTSKKRTYLQPQINKAQQVSEVCRDHLIIFNGDISQYKIIDMKDQNVCTILKKPQKEVSNLPCQEHPYDHFVVKAVITVNLMPKLIDRAPITC